MKTPARLVGLLLTGCAAAARPDPQPSVMCACLEAPRSLAAVFVSGEPGLEASLDGQPLDLLAQDGTFLPTGAHTLTVRAETGERASGPVELVRGCQTRVDVLREGPTLTPRARIECRDVFAMLQAVPQVTDAEVTTVTEAWVNERLREGRTLLQAADALIERGRASRDIIVVAAVSDRREQLVLVLAGLEEQLRLIHAGPDEGARARARAYVTRLTELGQEVRGSVAIDCGCEDWSGGRDRPGVQLELVHAPEAAEGGALARARYTLDGRARLELPVRERNPTELQNVVAIVPAGRHVVRAVWEFAGGETRTVRATVVLPAGQGCTLRVGPHTYGTNRPPPLASVHLTAELHCE